MLPKRIKRALDRGWQARIEQARIEYHQECRGYLDGLRTGRMSPGESIAYVRGFRVGLAAAQQERSGADV